MKRILGELCGFLGKLGDLRFFAILASDARNPAEKSNAETPVLPSNMFTDHHPPVTSITELPQYLKYTPAAPVRARTPDCEARGALGVCGNRDFYIR